MKGWPGKGKLNLMNRVEKKNIKSISKPRLHYHYSNVEYFTKQCISGAYRVPVG